MKIAHHPPATGDAHVNRGGGWYFHWALTRCAARDRNIPTNSDWTLGVRVARPVGPR
jgi:formylglycine-generating enzyme required for sulfatase activity